MWCGIWEELTRGSECDGSSACHIEQGHPSSMSDPVRHWLGLSGGGAGVAASRPGSRAPPRDIGWMLMLNAGYAARRNDPSRVAVRHRVDVATDQRFDLTRGQPGLPSVRIRLAPSGRG